MVRCLLVQNFKVALIIIDSSFDHLKILVALKNAVKKSIQTN